MHVIWAVSAWSGQVRSVEQKTKDLFWVHQTPQGFLVSLDEAQVFAWYLLKIISHNVRSAEDYTACQSQPFDGFFPECQQPIGGNTRMGCPAVTS
jgi:hypothetical protein